MSPEPLRWKQPIVAAVLGREAAPYLQPSGDRREPPDSDRIPRPALTATPKDRRVESAEHPFDTKV
jgi:hypothetical protein